MIVSIFSITIAYVLALVLLDKIVHANSRRQLGNNSRLAKLENSLFILGI